MDPSPKKPKVMWWPLVFSPFIAFVFLDPFQRHAGRVEWFLTILGVLAFLGLFAVALVYLQHRAVGLAALASIALLGFIFAPFNDGAALFLIYATAFVPYVVAGEIGLSAAIIGLLLLIVGAESWILHLRWVFPAYSVGYGVILGVANTWAARKSLAIEGLARVTERERIARDLHDVLGHTLTVIIVKAELAGKLLDRDLERTRTELADLEQISREALAEVRSTIRGYRAKGLDAEFRRATATLETAGVAVECAVARVGISPAQENALALVIREAITNIVRHARAKTCRMRLLKVRSSCRLEIQDDGEGGFQYEGNGQRGMRERIEALGGSFFLDTHKGTKLTITLPLGTDH